jgi:hypothetical protein
VTISCLGSHTSVANGLDGCNVRARVFYPLPTATGGCGTPTATCVPEQGSYFPLGTTTVECTASNPELGTFAMQLIGERGEWAAPFSPNGSRRGRRPYNPSQSPVTGVAPGGP